jgi:tetratricopeptide (TPR) repeat protein
MRSVTVKFPQFAPAYNNLAYWLWLTGDRREALDAVRKYVELAPDHPNSHDSYAELLQWEGQYQEAADHYRRAVELDESYTEAYVGLAEVHQLSGRGHDARAQLAKAAERSSGTAERLNFSRAVANSYLMEGNSKRGVEELERVAADAEANDVKWIAAIVHRQLAAIDGMAGKGRSIEERLAKAAEIEGNVPAQQAFAALSYGNAGRMQEAWEALRKLEEAAQEDSDLLDQAHTLKGLLYLQQSEPEKAVEALIQADPENDFARVVLAECYAKLGRRADARAFRAEVLRNRQMSFFDTNAVFARFRAQRM